MLTALVVVFIIVYAAIAFEHPIKINKSASALVGAGLLWTIYAMSGADHHQVGHELGESLMGTAQIVFFLMGAMTIVEVVDAHHGFEVITKRIRTKSLSSLMWLVGFVTFFLSAVLDNLTTTIVMISLMKKLLDKHDERLFLRRHHRHRGQLWRRVDADWRRDHHDAVDRRSDHDGEHHEVGVLALDRQLAHTTVDHVLCLARAPRGLARSRLIAKAGTTPPSSSAA